MKVKRIAKTVIDIAMFLIFLPLMEERSLSGAAHEWLGISLFILFIAHVALNYRFFATLFKGKYSPARIVTVTINFLLLAAMIMCVISSLFVSGVIFKDLNLGNKMLGRNLHLVFTAWAFLLANVHFGLHLPHILCKIRLRIAGKKAEKALVVIGCVASVIIIAYGLYAATFSRRIYEELFFLTSFKNVDESVPMPVRYIEVTAMALSFALIAYFIKKLFSMTKKLSKGNTKNENI